MYFLLWIAIFLKILFIVRDREKREHRQGGQAEGEAGTPPSKEPDAVLDPRTVGSGSELKADAKLIMPPRRTQKQLLNNIREMLWDVVN